MPRTNVLAVTILAIGAAAGLFAARATGEPWAAAVGIAAGLLLMPAPRIAEQWERAIVLRFGRFTGLRGADDADRPAARPRAHRERAAAADRSAVQPVGRHGVVGRDARRGHSRCAAGRDVARGAGGAREAGGIILGEAELEIAHSFAAAARSYHDDPTALHLRAMNRLYEGLKEKGALMLVPSSAVESMGMRSLMGAAALRQTALTDTATATPGQAPATP